MLLYVTLGTNDVAAAKRFYAAIMPTLGYMLRSEDEDGVCYGPPGEAGVTLWVEKPYDGKPASFGNGTMLALVAPSRAAVDAFYAAGLANGGSDEGAPGLRRYGPNFYACYLRDPDGNKLSPVCETEVSAT